jgi:hypothetical protein
MTPITAWVCAPPKTGSTWISMMLSWALDWQTMSLIASPGRGEQEIRVTRMFTNYPGNLFLPHTHTKASEATIGFVKGYNVKVIMPIRNLLDTLTSAHDHLTTLGPRLPCGFISSTFKSLTPDEQRTVVINIMVPWYVSFYASWAYAIAEHGIKVHFVDYDAMLRDARKELVSALSFIGVKRTDRVIDRAVDEAATKPTRFNKGVTGRGETHFSITEIQKIDEIVQCHKDPIITSMISKVWVQHIAATPQQTNDNETI